MLAQNKGAAARSAPDHHIPELYDTGGGAKDDRRIVAALDTAYQAAVKRGDARLMDAILHEDFALVRGDGGVATREEIIGGAASGACDFEIQDEIPGTQKVRVWGDTAVVTALLHEKGTKNGEPFETQLWFSDTYVRTAHGWRYAFAQVSLPLPEEEFVRG